MTTLAALELRHFIEKMSGARLPIVTAPGSAAVKIHVGESAATKRLDVTGEGLRDGAYCMDPKHRVAGAKPTEADPWFFNIGRLHNAGSESPEQQAFSPTGGYLTIERPDQVWSADITYVPLRRGFMYLVAVLDWHSRYVLSWELSNTLDSSFCVSALQAALGQRQPEIFNTDQGAQFTSQAFTSVLQTAGIAISMDGRGRALDNVFIERLWRTVKYENIYLQGYETAVELKRGLASYFDFYRYERLHMSLDYQTPWEAYSEGRPFVRAK